MGSHERRYRRHRPGRPLPPPEAERWTTCPACGKRSYFSRSAARQAARTLPPREDGALLKVYRCRKPPSANDRSRFHVGHVNPRYLRRDLNATTFSPQCTTACHDWCDLACHEGHRPIGQRDHHPKDCPAYRAAIGDADLETS